MNTLVGLPLLPRLRLRLPMDHNTGRLVYEHVEHEPVVGQPAVQERLPEVREDGRPPLTHSRPGVRRVETICGEVVAERYVVLLKRLGVEEHDLPGLARAGGERVGHRPERGGPGRTPARWLTLAPPKPSAAER